MHRVEFHIGFHILHPIPGFPLPHCVAGEEVSTPKYRFAGATRGGPPHCVFQYTVSGEGRFRVKNREFSLPASSGFLCEVLDPDIEYFYPEDGKEIWRFIFIAFSGETAEEMTREMNRRYGYVFNLSPDSEIIRRLHGFEAFGGTEQRVSPADGAELVTTLLYSLSNSREREFEAHPNHVLVRKAMDFIDVFADNNINAGDIARLMNISREHLSRIFKQRTGISPYQYILRRKMLNAARLLRDTRLSIKEIALRAGFETTPHFSRAFKRMTGVTPSEFRDTRMMPML